MPRPIMGGEADRYANELRAMIDRLYREPRAVIDAIESLEIDAAITRALEASFQSGAGYATIQQRRSFHNSPIQQDGEYGRGGVARDTRPHHITPDRLLHDQALAELEDRERATWGPIDETEPRWEGCEEASQPPWSQNGRCLDARCKRCWGRMK